MVPKFARRPGLVYLQPFQQMGVVADKIETLSILDEAEGKILPDGSEIGSNRAGTRILLLTKLAPWESECIDFNI